MKSYLKSIRNHTAKLGMINFIKLSGPRYVYVPPRQNQISHWTQLALLSS